ncbi:RHS repeat-associated core domain-containing protein [Actinosynnema sp. NPDC023587]|uniref:RHS repeat-associated core domain-containing protein n=1 Tax=Actinosynnema sp. NPDC023587 TaxID=3154695 RepID=UPI0033F3CCC8
MNNPLLATAQSDTTAVTGIGIAESAADLASGISDGSWVAAGLGGIGVGLEVLSMVLDPIGTVASYGVGWLIEHVQPLKEALDWFAGDPPVIRSFSETWSNVAAEVGRIAADLGTQDAPGWQGAASAAYRSHAAQTADAIAGAGTLAEGVGTGVMVMGEVVAAVREIIRDLVAEVVGKLITWALEAVATLGLATPLIIAQATSTIARVCNRIADLVRKLVKTIANVTPRIRKVLDKLGEIMEKLGKLGRRADTPGNTTPSSTPSTPDAPTVKGPDGTTNPSSTADGTTSPSGTTAPSGTTSPSSTTSPDTASSNAVPGGTNGNGSSPAGSGNPPSSSSDRPSLREDTPNPRDRAQTPEGRCEGREPIDLASGEMYLAQIDVELSGVLSLLVGRVHVSSYRAGRLFGPSWASTMDQRLEVDDHGVYFADPDGVVLVYPLPPSSGTPVLPVEGARWSLARNDSGYVITQPKTGLSLHFPDAAHAPISAITDRNGNRIDFEHTGAVPSRIRHSGGYDIVVDSENGHVTGLRLDNPAGDDITLVSYRYDDNRLTEVLNSSGAALRFEYDHAGRITRWVDRNGEWYGYEYDHDGRCVRTTGSGGALTGEVEYDLAAGITREVDSLGHVTHHHFNDVRQLVRRVDPLGSQTLFQWDRYDRLVSTTDALGLTTSYLRDDDGEILALTRPDGTQLLAEYNEFGKPTRQVDPDGTVWLKDYDSRGNLVAVTDPSGAVTRYEYSGNGGLTAVVDAAGGTHRTEVDATGLPIAVTDARGATTRYVRDAVGRVRQILDSTGGVTVLSWTVEGKLLGRTHPDRSSESWRYDAEGNEIEHVDRVGQRTRTRPTHFDLPADRILPDGSTLHFDYDTELRLVSVTDQTGSVWRYEYDAAGSLVRETGYGGQAVEYARDAAGRVVRRSHGPDDHVELELDPLGRVLTRSTPTGTSRFRYDEAGRVVWAANGHAETVFRRDVLGRVVEESTNGRTLVSRYDAVGRRVSRVTPTGARSDWTYDPSHLPTALHGGVHTLEFTHDAAGREVGRRFGNAVLAQRWDAAGRLADQDVSTVDEAGVKRRIGHRRYHYRADGYLTAVEEPAGPRTYDLDALGRVVSVHGPRWSEQYAYDPAGNLAQAATPGAEPASFTYEGTLLRQAGRTRFDYDRRGRVVRRVRSRLSHKPDVWHYTWDTEDRLTAVVTPDQAHWRYTYDAMGRRIAKQRTGPAGEVLERTEFVWDGTVLAEQIEALQAMTWDHDTTGMRPVVQRLRVPTHDAAWVDREFHSIVTDLVGAPAELVTPNGHVMRQERATLWGRTVHPSTPLRFPGQYHDRESGLHYNYSRYYDPETARYVTDDPLGIRPSPNPRAYVPNPTRFVDPLGLSPAPGGSHALGTGSHTNPPPPRVAGPISMDEAVELGARHAGDNARVVPSGSGGYQFIGTSTDSAGNRIASVARFDINPASPHVQQLGPHLNLETQVNGNPVRSGPYNDPHIPIDPSTIRPGDIP